VSGPIRVLFAGTPDVALPSLEAIAAAEDLEVVAVLTNPDRPRGRSGAPVASPVAQRAAALGITLLQPERVADVVDVIAGTGADVGAVVAYGSILPPSVLSALPLGFVNLHFSLLPRWRGAAPVQHAIAAGDAITGVTAFLLDEGMDTGPVLRTLEHGLPDDADAGTVLDRLAEEGAAVLVDALRARAAGEQGTAQPAVGVTRAPRIGPADAQVPWGRSAEEVGRHIRSVTPRPGAATTLAGAGLKVADVAVVRPDEVADGAGRAGTVIAADDAGIVVACGSGALRVRRVQLAGRPWSDAADQVRGRRIAVGMVLGADAADS